MIFLDENGKIILNTSEDGSTSSVRRIRYGDMIVAPTNARSMPVSYTHLDHLYEIITMQEGDQIEYLKELFDDEEDAYLDQYCMERGAFDLLAFHNDLKAYVREHGHEFYIQSGNPEEYQDLEAPNVHVVYDPGVHEGVRVSYKNTCLLYTSVSGLPDPAIFSLLL